MNKDACLAYLDKLLHDKVHFALLFGSAVDPGEFKHDDSDVDCGAFFLSEDISLGEIAAISHDFFDATGRKLDLIPLRHADIIICSQIIGTGKEFIVNSPDQLVGFKAHVLRRYGDFKQSRKIIEDNILVKPKHDR